MLSYARKALVAGLATLATSVVFVTSDGEIHTPEVIIGLGATLGAALAVFATTNTPKVGA